MKTKTFIIMAFSCLAITGLGVYLVQTRDLPLYAACCITGIPLLGCIISLIMYECKKNKEEEQVTDKPMTLEQMFAEFTAFIGRDALDGKTGGYFVEKRTSMCSEAFASIAPVGNIPEEKAQKCIFLAKEKANRLLLENIPVKEHLSSYESRDEKFVFPENNQKWGKWGGAIFINYSFTIYSFSGISELRDEAFVCWVAWRRNELSIHSLEKICRIRENNPFLQQILEYASKYASN